MLLLRVGLVSELLPPRLPFRAEAAERDDHRTAVAFDVVELARRALDELERALHDGSLASGHPLFPPSATSSTSILPRRHPLRHVRSPTTKDRPAASSRPAGPVIGNPSVAVGRTGSDRAKLPIAHAWR